MLKITRWRPDTCNCVILKQWDDSLSEDDRVEVGIEKYTFIKDGKEQTITRELCPAHSGISDPDQHFKVIREESQRRQRMRVLIYENGAKKVLTPTEKQQLALFYSASGQVDTPIPDEVWNPEVKVNFSYDANRDLIVDIKGLTPAQKATLATKKADLLTQFPTWGLKVDKIKIK